MKQREARKCYEASLKGRRRCMYVEGGGRTGEDVELDPRVCCEEGRPQLAEEAKMVEIREGCSIKIGCKLKPKLEKKIVQCLKENMEAFSWSVADMPGINHDVTCHKLLINGKMKLVAQRRRKLGEEKREVVIQEVEKLKGVGHVKEIQYPSWLSNVVLVKKLMGNGECVRNLRT